MIYSVAGCNYKDQFEVLLEQVSVALPLRGTEYLGGAQFERQLLDVLQDLSKDTVFENTFEITGKNSFPDIVSQIQENKWLGIEVKTSKADWTCFGNSIFEGTRIKDVQDIYIFFAILSETVKCRWGAYEDCIETINITHSPRYQINMALLDDKKSNVFAVMGLDYDGFRCLSHSEAMSYVRKLKREQYGADIALWWLPENEEEEGNEKKLEFKTLSELSQADSKTIKADCLAMFPEIFGNSSAKFNRVTKWLASEYGVVSHALRDNFSAGGRVSVSYKGRQLDCPRIIQTVLDHKNEIRGVFDSSSLERVVQFWPADSYKDLSDVFESWITMVSRTCKEQDRKYIAEYLKSEIRVI